MFELLYLIFLRTLLFRHMPYRAFKGPCNKLVGKIYEIDQSDLIMTGYNLPVCGLTRVDVPDYPCENVVDIFGIKYSISFSDRDKEVVIFNYTSGKIIKGCSTKNKYNNIVYCMNRMSQDMKFGVFDYVCETGGRNLVHYVSIKEMVKSNSRFEGALWRPHGMRYSTSIVYGKPTFIDSLLKLIPLMFSYLLFKGVKRETMFYLADFFFYLFIAVIVLQYLSNLSDGVKGKIISKKFFWFLKTIEYRRSLLDHKRFCVETKGRPVKCKAGQSYLGVQADTAAVDNSILGLISWRESRFKSWMELRGLTLDLSELDFSGIVRSGRMSEILSKEPYIDYNLQSHFIGSNKQIFEINDCLATLDCEGNNLRLFIEPKVWFCGNTVTVSGVFNSTSAKSLIGYLSLIAPFGKEEERVVMRIYKMKLLKEAAMRYRENTGTNQSTVLVDMDTNRDILKRADREIDELSKIISVNADTSNKVKYFKLDGMTDTNNIRHCASFTELFKEFESKRLRSKLFRNDNEAWVLGYDIAQNFVIGIKEADLEILSKHNKEFFGRDDMRWCINLILGRFSIKAPKGVRNSQWKKYNIDVIFIMNRLGYDYKKPSDKRYNQNTWLEEFLNVEIKKSGFVKPFTEKSEYLNEFIKKESELQFDNDLKEIVHSDKSCSVDLNKCQRVVDLILSPISDMVKEHNSKLLSLQNEEALASNEISKVFREIVSLEKIDLSRIKRSRRKDAAIEAKAKADEMRPLIAQKNILMESISEKIRGMGQKISFDTRIPEAIEKNCINRYRGNEFNMIKRFRSLRGGVLFLDGAEDLLKKSMAVGIQEDSRIADLVYNCCSVEFKLFKVDRLLKSKTPDEVAKIEEVLKLVKEKIDDLNKSRHSSVLSSDTISEISEKTILTNELWSEVNKNYRECFIGSLSKSCKLKAIHKKTLKLKKRGKGSSESGWRGGKSNKFANLKEIYNVNRTPKLMLSEREVASCILSVVTSGVLKLSKTKISGGPGKCHEKELGKKERKAALEAIKLTLQKMIDKDEKIIAMINEAERSRREEEDFNKFMSVYAHKL